MNPRTAPIVAAAAALMTASAAHAQVIGCACDGDYEVGDRVSALVDNPTGASGVLVGTIGTVICGTGPSGLPESVLVRWDGMTRGSSVNVLDCDCEAPAGGGTSADWFAACDEIALLPVRNSTQGTWHPTIADGIAGTVPGDVLELGATTFFEHNLVLSNKDITIRGQGEDATIIDGGRVSGSVFKLRSGDESMFEGLTIQNGRADLSGGGGAVHITGDGTNALFRACRFRWNHSGGQPYGGAMYIERGGFASIETCEFTENEAPGGWGADIGTRWGSFEAIGSLFSGTVRGGGSVALLHQAIGTFEPTSALVLNCTFAEVNSFRHLAVSGPLATLDVIGSAFDDTVFTEAVISLNGGVIGINRNNAYRGAPGGNTDGAPTFADAPNGDFRLAPGSLGIDAADYDAYAAAGGPLTDLAGAFRLQDDPGVFNTGVGATTQLDCGAFEFQGASPPPVACPGDINGDGYTDLTDFGIFASDFGCTPAP